MMKNFNLLLILCVVAVSCENLFEEDISDENEEVISVDLRDSWVGDYNGVTDALQAATFLETEDESITVEFVKSDIFFGGPGSSSSRYFYRINLPSNYRDISGLRISENSMSFSATTQFPFDWTVSKVSNSSGSVEIRGDFKFYQLTTQGNLSLIQHFSNVIAFKN